MSNTTEQPKDVDNTKQKQPEEIRVEVVQEEDTEEILNMLKAFFFKVSSYSIRMPRKLFVYSIRM